MKDINRFLKGWNIISVDLFMYGRTFSTALSTFRAPAHRPTFTFFALLQTNYGFCHLKSNFTPDSRDSFTFLGSSDVDSFVLDKVARHDFSRYLTSEIIIDLCHPML